MIGWEESGGGPRAWGRGAPTRAAGQHAREDVRRSQSGKRPVCPRFSGFPYVPSMSIVRRQGGQLRDRALALWCVEDLPWPTGVALAGQSPSCQAG
jgi:hypothetical protein